MKERKEGEKDLWATAIRVLYEIENGMNVVTSILW